MVRVLITLVLSLTISASAWGSSSDSRFQLDKDIGFGLWYRKSLFNNFQEWGATITSEKTRLGTKALRFETKEGFCGFDKSHSDCRSGRNRHEFSSSLQKDGKTSFRLGKRYWHAISVYVPSEPIFLEPVETSIFQFHGQPVAWKFHFDDKKGFYLTNYINLSEGRTLQTAKSFVDKWNDIIIEIIHKRDADGILNIWLNGEKIVEYTGVTTHPGGKPYLKFGIYNTAKPQGNPKYNEGKNFKNLWAYFDEIRFAETCEELKLDDLGYSCPDLISEPVSTSIVEEAEKIWNRKKEMSACSWPSLRGTDLCK